VAVLVAAVEVDMSLLVVVVAAEVDKVADAVVEVADELGAGVKLPKLCRDESVVDSCGITAFGAASAEY